MKVYWAHYDMIDYVLFIMYFPNLMKHIFDTRPLSYEFGDLLVQ